MLTIRTLRAFVALVLSADLHTGDGAFLTQTIAAGVTRIPVPIARDGVHVEIVDANTGTVWGSFTVETA